MVGGLPYSPNLEYILLRLSPILVNLWAMPIYLGRLGHGSMLREQVLFHAKPKFFTAERYLTLVLHLISHSSPKLVDHRGFEPQCGHSLGLPHHYRYT